MNLQTKKQAGFTIVELLIVIVVIGILAAITIVAYNGIQNRSKATAGQNLASQVAKKAEAYNTIESAYPTHAQLTGTSGPKEAILDNPNAVLSATITSGTAKDGKAVSYVPKTGGACVGWWNYAASPAAAEYIKVGPVTCP